MTKQLKDILFGFTTASDEDKLDKIRQVRHNRTIERPVAAKKRHKKAKKKVSNQGDKIKNLLKGMSEEERLIFLKQVESKNEQ